jgi:hypothetical protein
MMLKCIASHYAGVRCLRHVSKGRFWGYKPWRLIANPAGDKQKAALADGCLSLLLEAIKARVEE